MCGIAGVYSPEGDFEAFDGLFADIAHRGPDGRGVYGHGPLRLGMNRLRFRGADVPLPVQTGPFVSAFNGQVYGAFVPDGEFTAIPEGVAEEIAFATTRGPLADGMYAYARYDPGVALLRMGTDPHFIKPLFARRAERQIAFCSEFAPLLKHGGPNRIDADGLLELFAYGWYLSDRTYVADALCAWKNDIEVATDGLRFRGKASSLAPPHQPCAEALRPAIRASVARCIQGSGPIGLALSGGLDSTILAHELNALGFEDLTCITVLTADLEENLRTLDELHLPPDGAWRSWRHRVVEVGDEDFLQSFELSTLLFGHPTTMSSLALYQRLADAGAEEGIRALILGEGVDEYFAGYGSYANAATASNVLDYYRHAPREKLVQALFGVDRLEEVRGRFEAAYAATADLREIEVQVRLTRLLLRSDICLMSRSIEGRVPFLHNGIPALAMATPFGAAARHPGKRLLREAYADDLGDLAWRRKVRFKTPDAMLARCLRLGEVRERILRGAGQLFGPQRVQTALDLLDAPESFDADIACLLLSTTFLLDSGMFEVSRV